MSGGQTLALTVYGYRVNDAREPLPCVDLYQVWIDGLPDRGKGRHYPSAGILRRLATLKRAGDTVAEAARCCGLKHASAKTWLRRLPEHLK